MAVTAAGQAGGAGALAMTGTDPAARLPLAVLPTPLVAAPRLAEALGAGALYVKRDDLTGFAFAGNKARPLEFLLAAAIAGGADTLVTGGAPGSNFCAAGGAAMRAGDRGVPVAARPGPGPGHILGRHGPLDRCGRAGERGCRAAADRG